MYSYLTCLKLITTEIITNGRKQITLTIWLYTENSRSHLSLGTCVNLIQETQTCANLQSLHFNRVCGPIVLEGFPLRVWSSHYPFSLWLGSYQSWSVWKKCMWFPCSGKWLTMDEHSACLSSERKEDKEIAEERWKKERREKEGKGGISHISLKEENHRWR